MSRALSTASTGMQAQMTKMDVIAHNLANANTVGFKKSRADFQDLLYQTTQAAGEKTGPNSNAPAGQQIGLGTKLASVTKQFTQGALQRTDRDLDVAIAGTGFFQVTGPDGTVNYTRDGSFKVSADGALVNSDGYPLVGIGAIPANAKSVNFSPTGEVSYMNDQGIEASIGQISIANFVNPSGLTAQGSNLFKENFASGAPVLVSPGTDGTGQLQQYFLEQSNVSVVEEMVDMISTQRAYEVNSKVIKASDEMLQTANQT